MEIEAKYKRAKKLTFSAWVIAISWDFILKALNYHGYVEEYGTGNEPLWVASIYICATGLLLYGFWLGSRAIDTPLTSDRFWGLLIGYPNWIPISIYLIVDLVIPVIYYEFFR